MISSYQTLCKVDDLEENQAIAMEINGKSLLVTKIEGQCFAIDNRCTHEDLPLSDGQVCQSQIECPHHGACFDLATGKATKFPAVVDVKTYEVHIENGNVLVAL